MAEQRAEVAAIVAAPEPATFENTIVALERSGALLTRAWNVFGNLTSSVSTPRMREIEREVAPLDAAHDDAIRLDPALFARVDAVHEGRHESGLDDEAVRLVERYHLDFVLAGARLDEAGRATAHRAEPGALDPVHDLRAEPAAGHRGRRRPGDRRRRARRARRRGDRHGRDRGRRPRRRGLPAHPAAADRAARAHQAAQPRPAPPGVRGLAQPGVGGGARQPSGRRAHRPAAGRPGAAARVRHARRRRPGRLDRPHHRGGRRDAGLDGAGVGAPTPRPRRRCSPRRPAATGSTSHRGTGRSTASGSAPSGTPSTPRPCARTSSSTGCSSTASSTRRSCSTATGSARGPELSGYHPDVRVWEVCDADGTPVGLYLGDFFAREGKRGGAWMSSFVRQSRLLGTQPVVVNNLNVSRAADGQPTLLTLDEVNTLFHEFGHALHGLSSAVTYPRFSGTAVPRDFVEFPSQVNEMWALWPEVLGNYAQARRDRRAPPGRDRAGDRRRAAVGRGLRDAGVPRRHPARPGLAPHHARTPRWATRSRSSSGRSRRRGSPRR